jgi:hypothetical protein
MGKKIQEERHPKAFTIANPMYDTVFKRLMENDRVVKFLISTLLEEEVISVSVCPQEYVYEKKASDKKTEAKRIKNADGIEGADVGKSIEGLGYTIYRVDFIAVVKPKEGKPKKILIEVQKAYDEDDVMRFRNYLADQYKREDEVDGISTALPIVTIYILGFNLKKIDSPCVKVARNYIDLINHQPINAKTPFMEKLTHDSYVIQAKKIAIAHYRTKLEQLLSIFEQAHFIEENSEVLKRYQQQTDDDDIRLITSILHEMGADPEERKKIEIEAEALRTLDEHFGRKLRAKDKTIEEKDKAIEEKDKTIEEKDKAIEEKDKAIEEKDKTIEEKNKAIEEKDNAIEETRKVNEEQAKRIAELERMLRS